MLKTYAPFIHIYKYYIEYVLYCISNLTFTPMNDLLSWTDTLENRRTTLESRLYSAHIADLEITCLPYLDASKWQFRDTITAARRILVLYALSLAAYKPAKRPSILLWLQQEQLKQVLSAAEKAFLQSTDADEKTLAKYSWNLEGAYILAWALQLVNTPPDPSKEAPISELLEHLPRLGESTIDFIHNLTYQEDALLVEECIFNDLAVIHLRRLYNQGARTVQMLHPMALFERQRALRWLVISKPQGTQQTGYTF